MFFHPVNNMIDAVGRGNPWAIPQFSACILNGKPMGLGKLHRQKTGHAGLLPDTKEAIETLHEHAQQIGPPKRDAVFHHRNIQAAEELIHPVPEIDRFALGYEVDLPCGLVGLMELLGCQDKGIGGIVDIGHINEIMPVADPAQLTATGPAQATGDQIGVAWPPNQVRPQNRDTQVIRVGGQGDLLGKHLAVAVVAEKFRGIGSAFIHPAEITFTVDHAWRAGRDKGLDSASDAGIDNVLSTPDICLEKIFLAPPNPGFCRQMDDRIAAGKGGLQKIRVKYVTAKMTDMGYRDLRSSGPCIIAILRGPRNNSGFNAFLSKPLHNSLPDKTCTARDNDLPHPLLPPRARMPRNINRNKQLPNQFGKPENKLNYHRGFTTLCQITVL